MSELETFAANINARVRGMKSQLFSPMEMESLIDRTPQGMAESLLSSAYEAEMAESLTRYQGADAVEDAVTRNLIHTFEKLRRLTRGGLEDLAEIFLWRWDLLAIKSLLRARHHELDMQTALDEFIPGPSMPVALMRELASKDTMDALVRGLVAWNARLARPLAERLGEYNETRDLSVLEEALDRSYFVDNVRRLENHEGEDAPFIRDLLRMEIDRINLRLAFAPRAATHDPDAISRRFLSRGTIPLTTLREIAASPNPERSVDILDRTGYADLYSGVSYYAETGRFSRLDRAFEGALLGRLKRASQQNPLSLAILMRFAWLKFNEVMNLRMIARGKDVNLPKQVIQEELVYG